MSKALSCAKHPTVGSGTSTDLYPGNGSHHHLPPVRKNWAEREGSVAEGLEGEPELLQ